MVKLVYTQRGEKYTLELIDYVDAIKTAEMDKDTEKEEQLRKENGTKPVTYDDVEAVVGYIIYNLTVLQKGSEKLSELKHDNLVNILDKYSVITKEQLEAVLKLDKQSEDAVDSFLKGEEE